VHIRERFSLRRKLASGWQYALHASQPLPVSQASKKALAVSVMVGVPMPVAMINVLPSLASHGSL